MIWYDFSLENNRPVFCWEDRRRGYHLASLKDELLLSHWKLCLRLNESVIPLFTVMRLLCSPVPFFQTGVSLLCVRIVQNFPFLRICSLALDSYGEHLQNLANIMSVEVVLCPGYRSTLSCNCLTSLEALCLVKASAKNHHSFWETYRWRELQNLYRKCHSRWSKHLQLSMIYH